jgi:diaminopimelate decarboxylase
LSIAGHELAALGRQFGTPLYVYDRATMDGVVARYKAALKAYYPGTGLITYAGKAFLCAAIAKWAREQGLWVDCTGVNEIATALAGGLAPSNIVVHGVNKSDADLDLAIQKAATIVVDNLSELERLASKLEFAERSRRAHQALGNLWLRLQPGVSIRTAHTHTQTGQEGSKFGMTPEEIIAAARMAAGAGWHVNGLHFHQGSNFRETAPLVRAIQISLDLAKEIGLGDAWHFSPGGGWGVAYHEEDLPNPDIDAYVQAVAESVSRRCRSHQIPLPVLHLEPGRSLMARAGVAIYRVGIVKRRPHRTWLLVDGGMADNPRYALYGTRYSCLPAVGMAREMNEQVSIGGSYCESGDMLVEDLMMPQLDEGEFIVIPVSGAYQLSMASNYNGACRPAVLLLENGRVRLMMRRETPADLRLRDAFKS